MPLLKDGDAWELAILEFAADFTSQDLNELGHLVAEANEDIASAVVEVKEDGNAKKKPAMNRRGGPT